MPSKLFLIDPVCVRERDRRVQSHDSTSKAYIIFIQCYPWTGI